MFLINSLQESTFPCISQNTLQTTICYKDQQYKTKIEQIQQDNKIKQDTDILSIKSDIQLQNNIQNIKQIRGISQTKPLISKKQDIESTNLKYVSNVKINQLFLSSQDLTYINVDLESVNISSQQEKFIQCQFKNCNFTQTSQLQNVFQSAFYEESQESKITGSILNSNYLEFDGVNIQNLQFQNSNNILIKNSVINNVLFKESDNITFENCQITLSEKLFENITTISFYDCNITITTPLTEEQNIQNITFINCNIQTEQYIIAQETSQALNIKVINSKFNGKLFGNVNKLDNITFINNVIESGQENQIANQVDILQNVIINKNVINIGNQFSLFNTIQTSIENLTITDVNLQIYGDPQVQQQQIYYINVIGSEQSQCQVKNIYFCNDLDYSDLSTQNLSYTSISSFSNKIINSNLENVTIQGNISIVLQPKQAAEVVNINQLATQLQNSTFTDVLLEFNKIYIKSLNTFNFLVQDGSQQSSYTGIQMKVKYFSFDNKDMSIGNVLEQNLTIENYQGEHAINMTSGTVDIVQKVIDNDIIQDQEMLQMKKDLKLLSFELLKLELQYNQYDYQNTTIIADCQMWMNYNQDDQECVIPEVTNDYRLYKINYDKEEIIYSIPTYKECEEMQKLNSSLECVEITDEQIEQMKQHIIGFSKDENTVTYYCQNGYVGTYCQTQYNIGIEQLQQQLQQIKQEIEEIEENIKQKYDSVTEIVKYINQISSQWINQTQIDPSNYQTNVEFYTVINQALGLIQDILSPFVTINKIESGLNKQLNQSVTNQAFGGMFSQSAFIYNEDTYLEIEESYNNVEQRLIEVNRILSSIDKVIDLNKHFVNLTGQNTVEQLTDLDTKTKEMNQQAQNTRDEFINNKIQESLRDTTNQTLNIIEQKYYLTQQVLIQQHYLEAEKNITNEIQLQTQEVEQRVNIQKEQLEKLNQQQKQIEDDIKQKDKVFVISLIFLILCIVEILIITLLYVYKRNNRTIKEKKLSIKSQNNKKQVNNSLALSIQTPATQNGNIASDYLKIKGTK